MPEQYDILRGMSRRRFLKGVGAAGLAAAAGPMLWTRPVRADLAAPTAPHLAYGSDPTNRMTVSWSTPGDGGVQSLRLREHGSTDWSQALEAETRGVPNTVSRYHHAPLDGLEPDTGYDYVIGEDGPAGTFRTAPATPGPFTFTAFGDQGVSDNAVAINNAVAAVGPAYHFHVGDLCYAYRSGVGSDAALPEAYQERIVSPAVWDAWLAQIAPLAAATPWMPTVGNHEMEAGYGTRGYDGFLGRFSLPPSGATNGDEPEVTYAFDYGNVRMIALDANDASWEIPHNLGYLGTAQDAWLEQQLATARAADSGVDWIVVGYHQCSYCTNLLHASDGGLRARWDSLFETYEVDLVVNGHNHSYERAHPKLARVAGPLGEIQPEVVDPVSDGPTFITAGSGGNPRIELSAHPLSYVTTETGVRVPEPAPWSVSRYLDLSFIAVDVEPRGADGRTSMTVRALTPQGAEVDRVRLER